MKEKKKSKKKVVCTITVAALVTVGAGILAYNGIPKFREFVNGILPLKKVPTIKTKPFRKYEIYKEK